MKFRFLLTLLITYAMVLSIAFSAYADTSSLHHDLTLETVEEIERANFKPVLDQREDVGAHWFDDAVFIGDSVSVYLSKFGGGEDALGNATFLVAGSYSATNALRPVSGKSLHPPFQGTKMRSEDAIALSGAAKVYIMLGMNDIGMGLDRAIETYITFVRSILEKAPGVQIYVQSVTPRVKGSTSSGKSLNNANISLFNEQMKAICQENGWYYVDVASILMDEEGYLRAEYCGDNPTMGIHIRPSVVPLWVEYLRTHTPQ